jgi:hypothetical protein
MYVVQLTSFDGISNFRAFRSRTLDYLILKPARAR